MSILWYRMNWLNRNPWFRTNPNWTLFSVLIFTHMVPVIVIIILALFFESLFFQESIFIPIFVIGIVLLSFILFLYTEVWYLERKSRSLLWLLLYFIPFGVFFLFALQDKGTEASIILSNNLVIQANDYHECLSYYEEEKKLQLLLERVGYLFDIGLHKYEDEYYKARKGHKEFWSSLEKIYEVQEYFSQAASEIVRRKQEMIVVPPLALSMSAAWEAAYLDTEALITPPNTTTVFDAIEVQARNVRQKKLVKKFNESWLKARKEERKFCKHLKISKAEVQTITANAAIVVADDEWLQILEAECP